MWFVFECLYGTHPLPSLQLRDEWGNSKSIFVFAGKRNDHWISTTAQDIWFLVLLLRLLGISLMLCFSSWKLSDIENEHFYNFFIKKLAYELRSQRPGRQQVSLGESPCLLFNHVHASPKHPLLCTRHIKKRRGKLITKLILLQEGGVGISSAEETSQPPGPPLPPPEISTWDFAQTFLLLI